MSHVERKSKYTKLAKLPDKSADSVVQTCVRVPLTLRSQPRWGRYLILPNLCGLNEHTNGLFRQYFPKGSDLSILSDTDVQRVEDKLNSRPRKILGYRTPREVFVNANNLPVALHC
jgi:IS30 family transposase